MITVIILTCNAGRGFIYLLESLQKQTVKPAQILVIDSSSSDHTVKLAESQNCKVIKINRNDFDHGTTRNLAIGNVSGEFAVLLTQDAIPVDEHMIAELINPLQNNPNIALCYGRQLPRQQAGPLESFAREFNYPAVSVLKTRDDIDELGLKTFFCSDSCSAIRCSIFKKLGGFKNNVIVNEDMLFAAKAITAGYSVYYSAYAKVYHSHPYSLWQTFRRYLNIGRFFGDNQWIAGHKGLRGYGSEMFRAGVKTFWQKKMPVAVIGLFVEFFVKAIAFKFGWYYQRLFC